MFNTASGEQIATGFTRLVVGGRGAYLEFTKEQLVAANLHMPENQEWRISSCKQGRAYYLEYRSNTDNVKIYYQRKTVNYADYRIGLFYIDPNELNV